MPRLTRTAVRLALLQLVIGTLLGALVLFAKGTFSVPFFWSLLPAHIELVLIGWTLQFGLAVAFWILPRHTRGRKRGWESVMWAGMIAINLGVALSIVGPFGARGETLTAAGHALELLGTGLALSQLWRRIRPTGAQA